MQDKSPLIAIIDSGIGGFTVLRAIHKLLPKASYCYLADYNFFPYGTKKSEEIERRVLKLAHKILHDFHPDILLIACNTASTLVLQSLRRHLPIPIIGIVPGIKPAAQVSRNKVVGLLATPETVKGSYTQNLIKDFAPHCEVIAVGSEKLVHLSEKSFLGEEYSSQEIKEELLTFTKKKQLDVIILACTHFPNLLEDFKTILPQIRDWIDPAKAVAEHLLTRLQSDKLHKNKNLTLQPSTFISTKKLSPKLKEQISKEETFSENNFLVWNFET